MRPVVAALISTLYLGHTLGFYVPPLQETGCGCGGRLLEYNYEMGPEPAQIPANDDVRYQFNFAVEKPKRSNSEAELKSYEYDVQTPPAEPTTDDTKYKFDYRMEEPAEDKPAKTPERTMYTKVDRVVEDKQECGCQWGKPCSCGYSPEQCAMNCNAPRPYDSSFVLPVTYDNTGDYVVYELPSETAPDEYVRRTRDTETNPLAEHMKKMSTFITEGLSQFGMNSGDSKLGSTQGSTPSLSEHFDNLRDGIAKFISPDNRDDKLGSTFDPAAMSDHVQKAATRFHETMSPILQQAADHFAIMAKPQSSRRKRESNPEELQLEKRIPTLRVKEITDKRDEADKYEKSRDNSPADSIHGKEEMMKKKGSEKMMHCNKCGSKLMDTTCKRCGTYQPQYVEYIEGKRVSYLPGASKGWKHEKSNKKSREAPRYVYDRYGHKYLENDGSLRLVGSENYQEPAASYSAPDYAGLAYILNNNREIMDQLNQGEPDRLFPRPVNYVKDTLDLMHDMPKRYHGKRSPNEAEMITEVKQEDKPVPRSMYQIVPMQYEGKDGKLVVKVYPSSNEEAPYGTWKYDEKEAEAKNKEYAENATPQIKKFTKNNKEYEIVSFNDYKGTEDEDIRHVLEHLHGKQSW